MKTGAPDVETVIAWTRRIVADMGDTRLKRDGRVLMFDDGRLWWSAEQDGRVGWLVKYSCAIGKHERKSPRPFWSFPAELRSEAEFRKHVKAVVEAAGT